MAPILVGLLLAAPFTEPTPVETLDVEGTWVTSEATVRRERTFEVPSTVTAGQWDLYQKRLWNLGVFSRVELRLEGTRAVARVEDRFPLGPIFRANFGGGLFYLWLGLGYNNLFGRAIEVRALYERFTSYNGFHVSVAEPRLFNQRLLGSVQVEWLFRPRPDFIGRRAAARLAFEWSPPWFSDDTLRPLLKLEGNSDEFPYAATDARPMAASRGLFVTPGVRLGRVDVDRLRLSGWSVEPRVGLGWTSDPAAPAPVKVDGEAFGYLKLGERFNLASRLLAGFLSGARLQDHFYIGGLDLVRGYRDSEVVANAWATLNLEARMVAFDSTWFAVMPAVFADAAVARRIEGPVAVLASAGLGVRLMVPRMPRFGVRFDVALPLAATALTPLLKPGISFGIWHFF